MSEKPTLHATDQPVQQPAITVEQAKTIALQQKKKTTDDPAALAILHMLSPSGKGLKRRYEVLAFLRQ